MLIVFIKLKMNPKINKLLIFLISLLISGCSATKLSYEPYEHKSVAHSIEILKTSLKYQSPNHKVKSIEIKHDYFKIIARPNNRTSYIHFESIGNIEFHEKNQWKIVTIRGLDRTILYRLYVKSDEIAKNFIDAVYTLMINFMAIDPKLINEK